MTVSIRRFIWGVLQWFNILDRSSELGLGGIKSPPRITAAMELFLLSASGYAVDTTVCSIHLSDIGQNLQGYLVN